MTYLKTKIPYASYGQIQTVEDILYLESLATNNVLSPNLRTFTGSGGTASTVASEFKVETGTSSGGYAVIRSFRGIRYHAGIGAYAVIGARFTTGVANSAQIVGVFNIGDGAFFGYNGTSFGVCHRRGGLAEVQRLTLTTPASGATNATVTLDGTAYTIPLTVSSLNKNAEEIATYLTANASATWQSTSNGATVTIVSQSDGNKSGSFAFSHATAVGSWSEITAGVTKTETWTAKASWNQNTASWLDPTKDNSYRVRWNFGYSTIHFDVYNPYEDAWLNVHIVQYANLQTTVLFLNPTMNYGIASYSLGSTTNLIVYSSNMSGHLDNTAKFTRNGRGYANTVTSVPITNTPLLSLRCRIELGGYTNKGELRVLKIGGSTTATKGAIIDIYSNPTLTTPQWAYISQSNGIVEYDISATAVTGGTQIGTLDLPPNGGNSDDLEPALFTFPPSSYLTFVGRAKGTGGATGDITVNTRWYEDVY